VGGTEGTMKALTLFGTGYTSQELTSRESVERLSNTELLERRAELQFIIAAARELLDTVNAELVERVKNEGTDNRLTVGERFVALVTRPVFRNVTIATAASFNAVKEVIDTAKLLPLIKAGRRIEGLTMTQYVTIN
jgi:hypothetical protein